jgi:hypothetical protein
VRIARADKIIIKMGITPLASLPYFRYFFT